MNFYVDYLEGQENNILPTAIQSAIDGRLGMFEDRMSKLLYKLTVEMDMGMSAALDCIPIDESYLWGTSFKQRPECESHQRYADL